MKQVEVKVLVSETLVNDALANGIDLAMLMAESAAETLQRKIALKQLSEMIAQLRGSLSEEEVATELAAYKRERLARLQSE